MKVYSIILDKEIVANGLANITGDGVLCVSPEAQIVNLWTSLITKRLETKVKSIDDFDAIRKYYFDLSERADFREKVEKSIEKVDGYLEEATTFRVVIDSIVDYVLNQCSKLCAELVSLIFDTDLVEGPNVISCKEVGGKVTIDWDKTVAQAESRIAGARTVVSAGYGRNAEGYVVKIGRAGSELTATSIAAILGYESVMFCTKKAGIQGIPAMTYDEAAHFCSTDDAPFFPAAMWPAMKYGVKIEVVNVLDPSSACTVISADASSKEVSAITGVVADRGLSLLTVYGSGLLGNVGISSDLFRVIAEKNVNIRFISQSSSEYSISFAVKDEDMHKAVEAIDSLMSEKHLLSIDDLLVLNKKVGIVSVCGDKMRNVPGISGKVFSAIGEAGISIIAAAQGGEELSISIVVDEADVDKGVAALSSLVD